MNHYCSACKIIVYECSVVGCRGLDVYCNEHFELNCYESISLLDELSNINLGM